jgi:hypothetical protein
VCDDAPDVAEDDEDREEASKLLPPMLDPPRPDSVERAGGGGVMERGAGTEVRAGAPLVTVFVLGPGCTTAMPVRPVMGSAAAPPFCECAVRACEAGAEFAFTKRCSKGS